ncbi:MAG: cytochrome c-type biogenesis protein CcmH [Pelagibacteraceae bacterium]|jgi:cytochrome c-type biogenesis protein CcmH|nr:cytochrome c-type biogenesis protein CcmH [Pelagibacteraceae bacterium]MBO6483943.1 cytochrome c-type biogenesis protein CcmH [Pelagibacteraceae bacterium]MBO6485019.1 cytochrome c-type biogenesis protein CcmH [Pelagibacteraceae bacterium]MBO6486182.1 cytochrome c-type biogenesis protein CcmH [Pelagibacteraceae bacterium]
MIKTFSLSVLIIVITILFSKTNIYSVEPEEFLQNPKQELKARNISKNVRCLVCQNQSIDESAAPLAKDLRILIRKKVKEGHTENEIYKFLTDRYGDFILLKPPLKRTTFMLWFLPFVFLAIGIFILSWHHKKSKKKLPHI